MTGKTLYEVAIGDSCMKINKVFAEVFLILVLSILIGCGNEESIIPNADSLSEDEISKVTGTYVGQDRSVLIIFPDGKAAYYYEGFSNMESPDDIWKYENNILTWYSKKIGCTISTDFSPYMDETFTDYELYMFSSDSYKWTDEYYFKLSGEAESMTDKECERLLASFDNFLLEDEEDVGKTDAYLDVDYSPDSNANYLIQVYNELNPDFVIKDSDVSTEETAGGYETTIKFSNSYFIISYADFDLEYAIASNQTDEEKFFEDVALGLTAIYTAQNKSYGSMSSFINYLKSSKNGSGTTIGGMIWYYATKDKINRCDDYELAVYNIPNW